MNGKHAYIIIYVYIDNIQVFWVYRESEWPGERKINICKVLETTIVPQMVIHRLCSYSLCLSLVIHYLQTSLTVQRANSKNARFPFWECSNYTGSMQFAFLHRALRWKGRGAVTKCEDRDTFHKLAEACSSHMHIVLLLVSVEMFLILTGDSQSLNNRGLTLVARVHTLLYYWVLLYGGHFDLLFYLNKPFGPFWALHLLWSTNVIGVKLLQSFKKDERNWIDMRWWSGVG